jgi:hypothetical protein
MNVRLHTYTIVVGAGVDAETATNFGPEVARVLGDERGWRKYGDVFREVKDGAMLVLLLAHREECDARCGGAEGLSCWSPQEKTIIFNESNWRTGSLSGLSPERYHNYIVSHEVGHYLGLSHQACPLEECRRRGLSPCRASVMQQMTLGRAAIEPCEAHDWPLGPDWKIDDPRRARGSFSSMFVLTLKRAVFLSAFMIASLVLLWGFFLRRGTSASENYSLTSGLVAWGCT